MTWTISCVVLNLLPTADEDLPR